MSINKVILIGNVGRDPQVRYFDTGNAVASFTLATTERGYTMQNGTTVPDRTEWHNIVFWGKIAETVEKYVHKGDRIYVEGKLRYRTYDDQNGIHRTICEVYADTLELLPRAAAGERSDAAPVDENLTADDLK
jgi:single-strand DNA-binding protein